MTVIESFEKEMMDLENPIEALNKLLLKYGLTPNQAKVYLFLSKVGLKTASEISKSLKIPRTETYHLLNTMQQKGIVFSVFGKPAKFNAIEIDEAISILLKNEKNRIRELENEKNSLIELWSSLPKYSGDEGRNDENKFQTLQGKNSILVKLEQMIKASTENILVLGTEMDFRKFYHTEFTELLKNTKSDLRILTDYSNKVNYLFEDVPAKKIKKIEDKNREDFCFIIKDDNEVIFFMNNSEIKDIIAIWTDSKSFVTTLKSLFGMIWKKSNYINESNMESLINEEVTYEHRLREIEQEKRILNYLHENYTLPQNQRGKK